MFFENCTEESNVIIQCKNWVITEHVRII
jgi:hypothetical protein